MNNKASKADAVKLIKLAVSEGWKREVEAWQPTLGKRSYSVTVCLHKRGVSSLMSPLRSIIVTFSLSRGAGAVSISSCAIYGFSKPRKERGLWSANYQIRCARQDAK